MCKSDLDNPKDSASRRGSVLTSLDEGRLTMNQRHWIFWNMRSLTHLENLHLGVHFGGRLLSKQWISVNCKVLVFTSKPGRRANTAILGVVAFSNLISLECNSIQWRSFYTFCAAPTSHNLCKFQRHARLGCVRSIPQCDISPNCM